MDLPSTLFYVYIYVWLIIYTAIYGKCIDSGVVELTWYNDRDSPGWNGEKREQGEWFMKRIEKLRDSFSILSVLEIVLKRDWVCQDRRRKEERETRRVSWEWNESWKETSIGRREERERSNFPTKIYTTTRVLLLSLSLFSVLTTSKPQRFPLFDISMEVHVDSLLHSSLFCPFTYALILLPCFLNPTLYFFLLPSLWFHPPLIFSLFP